MTLTPTLKFLILAAAGLVEGSALVWTGIKIDLLALDFNENAYNIVLTVITTASVGMTALLAYLGLRAPTKTDS